MNRLMYLSSVFLFSLLVSCAHHRDVRPGTEGIHRVITRGPDKQQVEQSAISQANHFCEQRNLAAAFVNEDTKYTGEMDESTHNTLRKASQAAVIVGGGTHVLGGRRESDVGGAVAGVGTVGSIMTSGDAYTVDMKFKCI